MRVLHPLKLTSASQNRLAALRAQNSNSTCQDPVKIEILFPLSARTCIESDAGMDNRDFNKQPLE